VAISASAATEFSCVIFTLTWSPGFALVTKTGKPLTRAMPSPLGLTSIISTSYVFPSSTGQSPPLPRLLLAFLGALFLGLIRHRPRYTS